MEVPRVGTATPLLPEGLPLAGKLTLLVAPVATGPTLTAVPGRVGLGVLEVVLPGLSGLDIHILADQGHWQVAVAVPEAMGRAVLEDLVGQAVLMADLVAPAVLGAPTVFPVVVVH